MPTVLSRFVWTEQCVQNVMNAGRRAATAPKRLRIVQESGPRPDD